MRELRRRNRLLEQENEVLRFLAGEARRSGWKMSRRTAWKLCSQAGITSSAQRTRRRSGKRPAPLVFDDYVQRIFTADVPNKVWVTDLTEHRTDEGGCTAARSKTCAATASSATPSVTG